MSDTTYVDLPDFVHDAKADPENPGLATVEVEGEKVEAVEVPGQAGGTTLVPLESLEDFQADPETGREFARMIRASYEQPEEATVADLLTLLDGVCGGYDI